MAVGIGAMGGAKVEGIRNFFALAPAECPSRVEGFTPIIVLSAVVPGLLSVWGGSDRVRSMRTVERRCVSIIMGRD